ncbi:MAG: diguanylate cyclase [Candidatus Omnitrophica bacterium]|nr:diguanylate cyclase [Candidatus Omnitrophota bacterium]
MTTFIGGSTIKAMNFLAFSGLFNFVITLSLGLFVLLRNYKNSQNRSYFYLCLSFVIHSTGYFFWQLSTTEAQAMPWFKLLTIGAIIVTVTYIHFIFVLIGIYRKKRNEILFLYIANALFIYCNMVSLFYTRLEPRHGLGFWPVITPLFNFYIVFWFAQIFYGAFWLVKGWKHSTGIKREQIKFFTIGAVIASTTGATNWLMWYNINFYPLTIFMSLYAWINAYAMVRLKFLNIASLTVRGIFFISYCLVLTAPILFGYMTNNWFLATILTVVAGTAGHLIFKWLVAKAEDRLLYEQKQYQSMLKNIAYQVLQYHDAQRLTHHIVRTCTEAVELSSACIYLRNREKGYFELVSAEHTDPANGAERIAADNLVIKDLGAKSDYLNIEAVMLENDLPNGNPYTNSMYYFSKTCGASLVFALRANDNLLGILTLGSKLNKAVFTRDDIDAFSVLSCQSALALENCRYMEEIKDLYEKAVTDKLTGCYNRLFYEECLQRALKNAREKGSSFYLVMLDMNYLKHLNDTYGHDVGDRILASFGKLLRMVFRANDIVVRYGGDEYSVLLENISRDQCEERIKRLINELILETVDIKLENEEVSIKMSASIGIADYKKGRTGEELFRLADAALFKAKNSGGTYIFSE